MGAGASAFNVDKLQASLSTASQDEMNAALSNVPAEAKAKVISALNGLAAPATANEPATTSINIVEGASQTTSTEPPPQTRTVLCDGCGKALHGEDIIWSDTKKNVDYSPSCYAALAADKKASLTQMTVNIRCGLEPPASAPCAEETAPVPPALDKMIEATPLLVVHFSKGAMFSWLSLCKGMREVVADGLKGKAWLLQDAFERWHPTL